MGRQVLLVISPRYGNTGSPQPLRRQRTPTARGSTLPKPSAAGGTAWTISCPDAVNGRKRVRRAAPAPGAGSPPPVPCLRSRQQPEDVDRLVLHPAPLRLVVFCPVRYHGNEVVPQPRPRCCRTGPGCSRPGGRERSGRRLPAGCPALRARHRCARSRAPRIPARPRRGGRF